MLLFIVLGFVRLYERNEVRKREAIIKAIEELGGKISFVDKETFRSKWLRPLLALKSPNEVVGVDFSVTRAPVTDARLANFASLAELKTLYLNNTDVTDAGLVHLNGLTKLVSLDLSSTKVTDA